MLIGRIILLLLNIGLGSAIYLSHYYVSHSEYKEKIEKREDRIDYVVGIIILCCVLFNVEIYLLIHWYIEPIYVIIQFSIAFWGGFGSFVLTLHYWYGVSDYERKSQYKSHSFF